MNELLEGNFLNLPYFKQSKKFFNPCPFQPQRYKERDFGAIPPSATPSKKLSNAQDLPRICPNLVPRVSHLNAPQSERGETLAHAGYVPL